METPTSTSVAPGDVTPTAINVFDLLFPLRQLLPGAVRSALEAQALFENNHSVRATFRSRVAAEGALANLVYLLREAEKELAIVRAAQIEVIQ